MSNHIEISYVWNIVLYSYCTYKGKTIFFFGGGGRGGGGGYGIPKKIGAPVWQ